MLWISIICLLCCLLKSNIHDIGQESAYTCKLQEPPTGPSQRPSSICNSKGSTQIIRYLFLRNNIQIRFLLRKLLRNIPYKYKEFLSREISKRIQPMVSSQKLSQDKYLAGNFRRKQSWKGSQTTTNLLCDPQMLHIHALSSKSLSSH